MPDCLRPYSTLSQQIPVRSAFSPKVLSISTFQSGPRRTSLKVAQFNVQFYVQSRFLAWILRCILFSFVNCHHSLGWFGGTSSRLSNRGLLLADAKLHSCRVHIQFECCWPFPSKLWGAIATSKYDKSQKNVRPSIKLLLL